MSDLNSDSTDCDIHICGRCRAEFHDIYKFIEHKKICVSSKAQALPNPNIDINQDGPSYINHNIGNSTHHVSHHNQSTFQPEKQSAKCLSYAKSVLDAHQYQTEQPLYNGDRNISYVYAPNQQTNICYEGISKPDINNSVQYNTSVDCNNGDQLRLEYGYEIQSFSQLSSHQKASNLDSSTTLPETVTVTSQEVLNPTKVMGIPPDSENSVDSSALCPEDLEVGQISEAMMGKLSQKFYSKGHGQADRQRNESKNKRVGRLDPISTFTLRKKCDRNSTNTKKDSARSLPFTTNRINTSSAPLTADCEEGESPVNHLDLKGISFEKRERLQGVSDDLLNQSPSTSTTLHTGNRTTSLQFQNTIESTSVQHTTYVTDNQSKNNSLYKAVFTSPSCGGQRLSVKIPEEENVNLKHPQQLSYALEKDVNIISLENTNHSSYKNISKLADASNNKNDNNENIAVSQVLEFERSGSLIASSTLNSLNSYDKSSLEIKTEGSRLVQVPHYEEVVKEYSVIPQQLNQPAVKISEQIYPSMSNNSHKESIEIENARTCTTISIPRAVDDNSNGSIVSGMTLIKARNSNNLNTIEYNSQDAEEIQVSVDQMNYLHLAGSNSENKDLKLSFTGENYNVEGDDTLVFVYKREDGSLIMMFKPDMPNCEGLSESTLKSPVESVKAEGSIGHEQSQDYQVHSSLVQRPEEICFEYKFNANDSSSSDHKIVNLDLSSTNNVNSSTSATPNVVYVQAPAENVSVNEQKIVPHRISGVNDKNDVTTVNNQIMGENQIVCKVKESSPRAKEKPLRESAFRTSSANPVASNINCVVKEVKKTVRGSGSNKIYSCHYGECSYSTKLEKDFHRHYRTHTGERPFKCDKCEMTFNRSDKLKTHLRIHAGYKPYKCTTCKYATWENSSLKKHMRIHTDERPYQCQICPYASRNSSQLVVHLRTHTGDAPFHCNVCTAQFKLSSDLKRHLRIHTGEKPFACDKCDYRCSNKGNLKIHFKINHSLENAKPCPQCSFVTSSMKRLREHIKTHDEARVIKCSVCSYTCSNGAALRSHTMVHNTLRPFRCTFCPYSSKQSGNLKKHIQNVHHEKQRRTDTTSSTQSRSAMKHSLSTLTDKSHHNSSSSRRRNKTRDDQYSDCNNSDMSVKSDYHHRPMCRSSSSRQIHVCHICGSGFVRQDSLRCHLKQHNLKETSPKYNVKSNGNVSSLPTKNKSSSICEQNLSVSKTKLPPPELPPLPAPPSSSLTLTQSPLSKPQPLQQPPRLQQQQQQQLPLPPSPQHPSLPPPPPPPTYRSKGLESIVAAASKLYREQYMNGEDEGEDEDLSSFSTTSTSLDNETNTDLNFQTTQVFNVNKSESFSCSTVESSTVNIDRNSSVPVNNHVGSQQCYSTKNGSGKRQWSFVHAGDKDQGRQPVTKKSKINKSSSVSNNLNQEHHHQYQVHCTNNDNSGQVPWEHSSYTASPTKNTPAHTQSSTSSKSKVSTSQIRGKSTKSKTSSSINHQQHRRRSNTSTQIQTQPNTHQNHTTTLYQYGNVSTSHDEVSTPSQPISIQFVPQSTPLQHQPSSQIATDTQNPVCNISFSQQQPIGVHQTATALQILVPAGTQMTQIIQPQPPSQLALGTGTDTGQQQEHQQQQIVFQVQEAPAAPRQNVITIPVSMAAPLGSQVVIGPSYGLVQNQVISAPADSTTMGSVYSVTEQIPMEDTYQSDFHQSSGVPSQEGSHVT